MVIADMPRPPLDEFLSGELNGYIRAQLLTAIEQLQTGRRYFTYNAFNVLLDAEADTVTVEDEFDVDRQSTVALEEFRKLLLAVEDS
ncbi:hypothetical protein [Paenarthrobacter aromaticivorans]|uniref:Uncharacterized protein n=1 Tax=Paenarthrobacter aromaticivorans TaxID=2849150 RepID=A0ABS6I4J1_9MICC|nr:hypothetical protein [Paenarthrobacter sp. MMS21-TAE1-1]MBU8866636.1 hypothetical protein [Paenarthrobacter sp. MMS21-TAE1-1]